MSRIVRAMRGRALAPAQAIVLGFGLTLVVGASLLLLPLSTAPGNHTTVVDALFTATSAISVTGLVVVDTGSHWSGFGLAVILVLIQLGGLGIMVVATLVGIVLARRLSMRARMATVFETKTVVAPNVRRIVGGIFVTSISIEAVVALILFIRTLTGYGYGVGFPVLRQLRREIRHPLHWSMNTRIVLAATVVLLALSTITITIMEWSNPETLGSADPGTRILGGFFHAVQTRTAGFNSVDVGAMHDETWLVMDILMFIGGGPAGTAGGIKVTTFAVLLFILWTELRGGTAVNIFGKRLARGVHRQAISVVLLAIAGIVVVTLAILAMTDLDLDQVLFEVVSAFGTVGLSTGITGDLPEPARVLIVILMFVGRLGPLTLGTALALKECRVAYELPKERPAIG